MATFQIEQLDLPSGGVAFRITWIGPGAPPTDAKLSYTAANNKTNSNNRYGALYTTDSAKVPEQWSYWDGGLLMPTPHIMLNLTTPVYVIPRYMGLGGLWNRYSAVVPNSTDSSQATASSTTDNTAGIVIQVMGGGGGGPEED